MFSNSSLGRAPPIPPPPPPPTPRTPIVLSAFRYSGRPENVALALCPQAMSQDPQHFRQPEMEASCAGVSAGASSVSASAVFICRFCSVSRAADPHDRVSEDGGGEHRHTPVWTRLIPIPFSHFCSKLIECVRTVACAVWLSRFETIQWKAFIHCQTGYNRFEAIQWKALSIVKLDTTVLRQYSGKHYLLSNWIQSFEAIQWKALSIVKLDTTVLGQYSGKHYLLSNWIQPFEAIQWKSLNIVKVDVLVLQEAVSSRMAWLHLALQ